MKRLRPILSVGAFWLSLAFCIFSAGMWSRSYWRVDSFMRFKPRVRQTQLWIDHRSTITFESGPVYEADSRLGSLRLLYVQSDGTYERTQFPARVTAFPADGDLNTFGSPPWLDSTRAGFGLEHRPVFEIRFNTPPGPQPPLPIAFVIHAVYTPWWFWTVSFALFPFWRAITTIRSRRRSQLGLCAVCGYDLRATPERCPECGVTIARAPRA